MALSGTNEYSLVGNQLVELAFNKLGVGSEGEPLTARMYQDGYFALNLLVKTWSAMDHLWKRDDATLNLIGGQAEYLLPNKPLRLGEVRRKTILSGYEVPLTQWSRQQYLDQPNKSTAPSTPVNFYYDPKRTEGYLYLWPAPSVQVAALLTIRYDFITRLDDMLVSNDEADVPAEWLEALVYNLAVRLMPQYPVNDSNLSGLIIQMAERLFADLKGWDQEPVSFYMQPDYMGMRGMS